MLPWGDGVCWDSLILAYLCPLLVLRAGNASLTENVAVPSPNRAPRLLADPRVFYMPSARSLFRERLSPDEQVPTLRIVVSMITRGDLAVCPAFGAIGGTLNRAWLFVHTSPHSCIILTCACLASR